MKDEIGWRPRSCPIETPVKAGAAKPLSPRWRADYFRRLDGMIRGTMPAARTVLPYYLIVRDST